MEKTMQTLEMLLQKGITRLQAAEIEEAALDAWYLMEYYFQMSRVQYFMNLNSAPTKEQAADYVALIERRATHVPLQHITGKQEFMGFSFQVNEHVLIPRQDTEVLVEELLKVCDGKSVLDMCTGSGCIILSLVKLCKLKAAVAADLSREALWIAQENAASLEAEVTWLQSNLFEQVTGTFDVIVSNPPYIKTEVVEQLMPEVKNHEPRMALDGREDGLYFYNKIIEAAPKYLAPKGLLYFEIGHDQGEAVKQRMESKGFWEVKVVQDLAGLDRVVYGKWKSYLEKEK